MKIATQTKPHPILSIAALAPKEHVNAQHAAFELGKDIATRDDRYVGTMLANEVMATAMLESKTWRSYAMRLIETNMEAREAFLKAIKATLTEARKANRLDDVVDKKTSSKRVASATVEVSKLTKVAEAWNNGATVRGLIEYVNTANKAQLTGADVGMIGYALIVEYARTFSTSKAGRTPDTLIVKFGKWIEQQAKAGFDVETDREVYNKIVAAYNELVPQAEPAPF
jgi:hypothetical protein